MNAIAADQRVLESEFTPLSVTCLCGLAFHGCLIVPFACLSSALVDGCMEEDGAGAARMTGTLQRHLEVVFECTLVKFAGHVYCRSQIVGT